MKHIYVICLLAFFTSCATPDGIKEVITTSRMYSKFPNKQNKGFWLRHDHGFTGTADNEKYIQTWYNMFLPLHPKRAVDYSEKLVYVYSHRRTIVILQNFRYIIEKIDTPRRISASELEKYWKLANSFWRHFKLVEGEGRMNYIFTRENLVILVLNIREEDYRRFVEIPWQSLIITRLGGMYRDGIYVAPQRPL